MPVLVTNYAYVCDATAKGATLAITDSSSKGFMLLVGGVYYSSGASSLQVSTTPTGPFTSLAWPDATRTALWRYSAIFSITIGAVTYPAILSEVGVLYRYDSTAGWVTLASGLPVVTPSGTNSDIYGYYGTQLADGTTVVLNLWENPSHYVYVVSNGVVSTTINTAYVALTAAADIGEVLAKVYFWTQLVGCTET